MKQIIKGSCPRCASSLDFVPAYLKYLLEYMQLEPRAVIVCPTCHNPFNPEFIYVEWLEKQEKVPLFVYGTLKRGHYNYDRFMMKYAEFKDVGTINGDLYSLKMYPVLFESNSERVVPGEIFMVSSSMYNEIASMEIGAGYYEKLVTTLEGETVIVFFHNKKDEEKIRAGFPLIDSWTGVEEESEDVAA